MAGLTEGAAKESHSIFRLVYSPIKVPVSVQRAGDKLIGGARSSVLCLYYPVVFIVAKSGGCSAHLLLFGW